MYKAIKDVGEYKIGDVVPDSKALLWLNMYAVPHVEKVKEQTQKQIVDKEEPKDSVSEILEDYLARNQSVVRRNVIDDKLNKNQLEQLLMIELSDKSRPLIINTIKQKLRTL